MPQRCALEINLGVKQAGRLCKFAQCCPIISEKLLTDTQLCNNCAVAFDILLLQVIEKVSSVSDHLQQTASGVVILLVNLDVLGKLVYPLGEDSDMYLWRTRVVLVEAVRIDKRCLFFFS